MKFTDSHCHLDFSELSEQLPALVEQCQKQHIHRIIVPSVEPANWQAVINLTQLNTQRFNILPAAGIHPWYLNSLTDDALERLDTFVSANHTQLCAIGETGIDGKIAEQEQNLNKQKSFFDYHLHIANRYQLPIIIHHRKSHPENVALLKRTQPSCGGIVHAFSGSYQQAKIYLDMGLKLGIGGTISYERAKKTINTVKKLPIESLVLETDAPSMPLSGHQGQPNSPLRVVDVFNLLCELRVEPREELAHQLEINIDSLFARRDTKALSREPT